MQQKPFFAAQKLNPAISQYRDRRFNGNQEEFEDCLKKSTTLYVGNLSFYTTEEQIFEVLLDPSSHQSFRPHTCHRSNACHVELMVADPTSSPCNVVKPNAWLCSQSTWHQCISQHCTQVFCATQVFSRAGDVKRIIMGLDKHQMTPCGFAFVVYYTRQDAEDAVKYISGTQCP